MFAAGVGFVMRLELLSSTKVFWGPHQYREALSAHAAIFVFLVLLPGLTATFGGFLLPLMIGAKNLALPRLNLLGFYFYLIGVVFVFIGLCVGQLEVGRPRFAQ